MSLQPETYEAICSALYQMPFAEFLGEVDSEEGRVGYFHIGEKPKDMRVGITMHKSGDVRLLVEWRNYAADARNPLKGEKRMRLITDMVTESTLKIGTEKVITTILEIYSDVLHETGVAGMIADLVESPETESDD